jgi:Zn-dependent protease
MDAQTFALFPLWYAAFLLALTCHEAGHALIARWGGDDTAYLSGQVTLNPWPHIRREPFGTVLVPILTYFTGSTRWMMGWASAPYDPAWEERHPRRAALMSAAGPAANFLLFGIAFAVLKAGLLSGVWVVPHADELALDRLVAAAPGAAGILDAAGRFLSVVMGLNLILGVFNLLPFPPLDGIAVLAGLASPVRTLYQRMRAMPAVAIVGVIVAWRISPYVVGPVLRAAVRALLYG